MFYCSSFSAGHLTFVCSFVCFTVARLPLGILFVYPFTLFTAIVTSPTVASPHYTYRRETSLAYISTSFFLHYSFFTYIFYAQGAQNSRGLSSINYSHCKVRRCGHILKNTSSESSVSVLCSDNDDSFNAESSVNVCSTCQYYPG
jgi:hypothetical protein